MSTSLQAPLQELTYAPFLTEEGLFLAKATVEAIRRSENLRTESGHSTSPSPEMTARKIAKMINLMTSGVDVKIVPVQEELTVSQTGEFLCMSENHVNDLLDAGEFAFRMNGNERMVSRDCLLEFERKREEGNAFLNELLEMTQELETYDD